MKKFFPFLCVAVMLSFLPHAQATDLPTIEVPTELAAGEFAEGTITRLSPAEVAEFLPWAQNARNQLNRALTQAQTLPLRDRLDHIERAVRAVVARSGTRNYQLSMRFALNRGLLLVDELEKNTDMAAIGSQESALDLLQRSITVGLSFYESDLSFQQRAQAGNVAVVTEHARFGSLFMKELYPAVVNVLNAKAQYRLLYKLIEMVNWDLSRDAKAPEYAEMIVEAYEMGQDLPEAAGNDTKAVLRMIRRLNSLKIIGLVTAESTPSLPGQSRVSGFNSVQAKPADFAMASAALRSPSPEARRVAIKQLENTPGEDITKLLLNYYWDLDSEVRRAAYDAVILRGANTQVLLNKMQELYGFNDSTSNSNVAIFRTSAKLRFIFTAKEQGTIASIALLNMLYSEQDPTLIAEIEKIFTAKNVLSPSQPPLMPLGQNHVPLLEVISVSGIAAKRLAVARILGLIPHASSFHLLGTMLGKETDRAVINAISVSMTAVRPN